MKKILWLVLFLLLAVPVWGQVPVPYRFTPGTPASATQVNANFDALVAGALNVSGGLVTGNMKVNPGITIDGVDISKVFGEGTNTITSDAAKLISDKVPQLIIGYDATRTMAIGVDTAGHVLFDNATANGEFRFSDPIVANGGLAIPPTKTFNCTGCVHGIQLLDMPGLTTGAHGSATKVATYTVDADGRLTAAGDVDIAFPAPPVVPPSYALGPNQIPENAIINDPNNLLLRPGDNATITGVYTFTSAPVFPPGMNVPIGNITSSNYTFELQSAPLNPGNEYAKIWLMSSYPGNNDPANGDPAIRFTIGTSVASYGPFDIFPSGVSMTGATVSGRLTMSGVSRIFLNDGTATLPTLTFTNASDSGVYYAPSNNLGFQSVDFGARFVTANRAVMRAFRSGPSRLDFIVGSTITMSLVEQGIQIGSNGTSEPGVAQSVTNVNLYGDLIPPFGTNGVHSIGYPGASWNLMGAAEFIVTSDVRLKDIKGDIPSALAAVQSLSPKLASWKDKTRPGTFPSFSAQDVAATLDKRYGTHLAVYRKDKDAWGVDYDKLTPILWQAVKELNAKVDALEAKLAKHQH